MSESHCLGCVTAAACRKICRREERRRYKENYPEKYKEQKKRSRRNRKITHRKLPLLLYEWREWIFLNSPKFRKVYDKEYFNANNRKYYTNNREKQIAKVKAYTAIHGYKYNIITKRAANARRKHMLLSLEYTLTEEQWNKIIHHQNNRCATCNTQFTADNPATKDHIIPVSKGGGLTYENTQALCRSCNSRKQDRLDMSKLSSWFHVLQTTPQDAIEDYAKPLSTSTTTITVCNLHAE